MTDYYVRTSGDDTDTGLTPTNAWQTVDHGVNTMAAGDTLYVGGGVYREQVTVTAGGTVGNPKIVRGDFSGSETGDPGPVVITAQNSPQRASARDYCVDLNEQEFLEFYDLIFTGGNVACVGDADSSANWALEGVRFERCHIGSGSGGGSSIYVDVNQGATPATNGLQVVGCTIGYRILMLFAGNAVGNTNLKWDIVNCVFGPSNAGMTGAIHLHGDVDGANSPGGINVEHCLIINRYRGIYGYRLRNAANPVVFRENVVLRANDGISGTSISAGALVEMDNVFWTCYRKVGLGTTVTEDDNSMTDISYPLMGGIADLSWRIRYGWSPWEMFEPIIPNVCMGMGLQTGMLGDDVYDSPRPMGGDSAPFVAYFDASDDGPNDPNNKWTNDANAFDGSTANNSYCNTQGSEIANFLHGGGIRIPDAAAMVTQVRIRMYGRVNAAGGDLRIGVYTDGLGVKLHEYQVTDMVSQWQPWETITPPVGGWGQVGDVVEHLEIKCWKEDAGAAYMVIYVVQLEVS